MRLRRRWLALATLALHCAALTLLPLLHQRGHKYDHVHLGAQTIRLGDGSLADHSSAPIEVDVGDLHEAFDADLVALDLVDPGHFGIAVVDCSLASYTMADCARSDAPAHTFGDELAARAHRHPRTPADPFDPEHGLHSLEHFGLALTATPTFLLPPPAQPLVRLPVATPALPHGFSPLLALRARAPPCAA